MGEQRAEILWKKFETITLAVVRRTRADLQWKREKPPTI
jgi:hypothetical protein